MSELRRKPEVDYYKVLQVDTEAEPEVVEAAYRALSKKYHPDINPSPESQTRMSQINSAYDVLGDASKRRDYNLLRGSVNHYVKPATPAAATSVGNSYKTSPASNTTYNYRQGSNSTSTPKPNGTATTNTGNASRNTNTSNNTNRAKASNNQTSSSRPQNPYQTPTAPKPSARAEAQDRAKHGNFARAGHYIYDAKKKVPVGRIVILLCLAIVAVVVIALVLEVFLGNPLSTNFITPPHMTPTAALVPLANNTSQVSQPTITVAPTVQVSDSTLTRDNVLTFLQSNNLFAGRVGVNDILLNGSDALTLKVRLSDKGVGTNADIAAATSPPTNSNDPLTTLRASETTTYAVIYPLFHQFTQLKHIVLGLTNPNADALVYKADLTRDAAFGFYSWQGNSASLSVSDLEKLAAQDRLASQFGAPQDDKVHASLLSPNEAAIQGEISSWGIEGTTVTLEGSGLVSVSYLLNHNSAETQLDFMRILYALYTRFSNLDRVQITTAVAGQSGGSSVLCSRDLFDRIGRSLWEQKLIAGDVQAIYSSLPKTQAALLQQSPLPVGQPVPIHANLSVRTWQITVLKAEPINGVSGYTPNGKFQLWAVTVVLRNSGNQRLYPQPSELFDLVDSQHNIYQPDFEAAVQYNLVNNLPNLTPLDPSQQEQVTLIFSIQRGITNPQLRLQLRDGEIKGQIYIQ